MRCRLLATAVVGAALVGPASAHAAWTAFPMGAGDVMAGPVANASGLWFTASGDTPPRAVIHIANDGTSWSRPIPREGQAIDAGDGSVWIVPFRSAPFRSLVRVSADGVLQTVQLGRSARSAIVDSEGRVWADSGRIVIADATGPSPHVIHLKLRKHETPGLVASDDGSVWAYGMDYFERLTTGGRTFRIRAHRGALFAPTGSGAMWGARGFTGHGYRYPVRISAAGRVHVFKKSPPFMLMAAGNDGAVWMQPSLKGSSPKDRVMRLSPAGQLHRFSFSLGALTPAPAGAMWIASGTYDHGVTTPRFTRLNADGSVTPLEGGCLDYNAVTAPDGRVWEAGTTIDKAGNSQITACVFAP
jgi:hypothetical protein